MSAYPSRSSRRCCACSWTGTWPCDWMHQVHALYPRSSSRSPGLQDDQSMRAAEQDQPAADPREGQVEQTERHSRSSFLMAMIRISTQVKLRADFWHPTGWRQLIVRPGSGPLVTWRRAQVVL